MKEFCEKGETCPVRGNHTREDECHSPFENCWLEKENR